MLLMSSRLWQKMTRIRRKRSSSLRRPSITLYLALFPCGSPRWFVVSWPAESANWRICHCRDEFDGKLIDPDLAIGPHNCQFTRCHDMPCWLLLSLRLLLSFQLIARIYFVPSISRPNRAKKNLTQPYFHFYILNRQEYMIISNLEV